MYKVVWFGTDRQLVGVRAHRQIDRQTVRTWMLPPPGLWSMLSKEPTLEWAFHVTDSLTIWGGKTHGNKKWKWKKGKWN